MFKRGQLVQTPDGLAKVTRPDGKNVWVDLVGDEGNLRIFKTKNLKLAVTMDASADVGDSNEAIQARIDRKLEAMAKPCSYCGEPADHIDRYDSHRDEQVDLCSDCIGMVEDSNRRKRLMASQFDDIKTLNAMKKMGRRKRRIRRFAGACWYKIPRFMRIGGTIAAILGALGGSGYAVYYHVL